MTQAVHALFSDQKPRLNGQSGQKLGSWPGISMNHDIISEIEIWTIFT
jgi:hypothetical protein